jgi:O-antigen/teichoic acid export membrane protein
MSRDLFLYAVLTAVSKGLQFLLLPILTRLFAPADYGFIELVATVMGLVGVFMTLSIESALARHWQAAEAAGTTQPLLAGTIAFVAVVGAAALAALAAGAWLLAPVVAGGRGGATTCLVLAGAATWLTSLTALPQVVLRMERRVLPFGFIGIAQAVLGVVLALWFIVGLGWGLVGLFAGQVVAAAAALALSLAWVRPHLGFTFSWPTLRRCLAYSVPMAPAVAIQWFNGQVDRLVLATLLGLSAVGLFGAAAKVAMLVAVLVEAFRLAWLPLAMRKLDDLPGRSSFFRKALTTYLAALLGASVVLAAFAPELLLALTTPSYAPAHTAIAWLAGAQVLLGAANITNAGLLASGKTVGNSVAAAIASVVGVALALVLVPRFGLDGSAFGTFVAALVFAAALLVLSRREIALHFDVALALFLVGTYVAANVGLLALHHVAPGQSLAARGALLLAALAAMACAAGWSLRRDRRRATPAATSTPAAAG